jgi:hypothetical protein
MESVQADGQSNGTILDLPHLWKFLHALIVIKLDVNVFFVAVLSHLSEIIYALLKSDFCQINGLYHAASHLFSSDPT